MAWPTSKYENRNKPYQADYNRSFDTHTEHNANSAFAVNPPDRADTGPDNIPGVNTARRYVSPLNKMVDPDDYLGSTIGPREVQTGNAPSGGYSTLPGLGFASRLGAESIGQVEFPDRRRVAERSYSDDWENNQAYINRVNLGGEKDVRRDNVRIHEQYVNPGEHLPSPYGEINAIEDSPYRQDWPEPNRITMRLNPNPNRFIRDWDNPGAGYRGSGARYLNGTHYSMADHNSLTPYQPQIEGGTPVSQTKRNTYRLDPQPWDAGMTDSPTNTAEYNTQMDRSGGAYGNSYRL